MSASCDAGERFVIFIYLSLNEMAANVPIVSSSPQLESWHRYEAQVVTSGPLQTAPAPMTKASPSSEDWENIRPIFTHLYVEKDLPLKDVMVMLAQEYNFHAQYVFLIPLIARTKLTYVDGTCTSQELENGTYSEI
jgi:hypothetical protein